MHLTCLLLLQAVFQISDFRFEDRSKIFFYSIHHEFQSWQQFIQRIAEASEHHDIMV